MALKIRLSRGGSKKRPFYRIVVAEASAPRDGRYVERVGHYNPMVAKDNDQRLVVNGERITLAGPEAQPTERVQKLLSTVSLAEPVKLREQPKKSAPGKKRAEREAEAAAAAAPEAEAAAAAEAEAAPAEEALLKRLLLKKRQLKKLLLKRHLPKKPQLKRPAEEAPAEDKAEETPAEEVAVEEAPAEEASAEETPAEDEAQA